MRSREQAKVTNEYVWGSTAKDLCALDSEWRKGKKIVYIIVF